MNDVSRGPLFWLPYRANAFATRLESRMKSSRHLSLFHATNSASLGMVARVERPDKTGGNARGKGTASGLRFALVFNVRAKALTP
jgi:hypothetical protein